VGAVVDDDREITVFACCTLTAAGSLSSFHRRMVVAEGR